VPPGSVDDGDVDADRAARRVRCRPSGFSPTGAPALSGGEPL